MSHVEKILDFAWFSRRLALNSLPGNPTYNLTDFSASELLDNNKSVLTSFGIDPNEDELDLPYIYWIPKMHKNPYKQIHCRFGQVLHQASIHSSYKVAYTY